MADSEQSTPQPTQPETGLLESMNVVERQAVIWDRSQELLKGIYDMKFTKPSKIQEHALPLLLSNPPRNMIGQSQSGTGKTAAFALTMLSRVDPTVDATQAICLAPARELARQIMEVIQTMGKFTSITTAFAIKETNVTGKLNAHIIVATPGKLFDLIKRKNVDVSNVKVFVLDEADNMIDQQGLGDQSLRIRKCVDASVLMAIIMGSLMPKECQIVLFSATFDDRVSGFAHRFAPNANEIRLKPEELSVEGIKQFFVDCPNDQAKFDLLVDLYSLMTIGQSIIFVKRRDIADRIAERMTSEGHHTTSLHGMHDPTTRDRIFDDFRTGRSKVLITTNVLARGIDIQQVNLVINYDLPVVQETGLPDYETYLHRVGRTGRFGRTGVAINFVGSQRDFETVVMLQEYFGRSIVRLPGDNLEQVETILRASGVK